MEFRLLGPLEVIDGEREIRLGGPKQRSVLAHLLIRANQVVPTERLIDEIWGDQPPEAARNALQSYVSHLRKALGAGRIQGRPPGYALKADPDEVDALRFERLVSEGRGQLSSDPGGAARTLSEALALWRGPAFADLVDEPSLAGEISRLDELRITATEDRVAAELAAGRHAEVIPELEALISRNPLREGLWAYLLLALYRSGRQGEALAAFGRVRRILAEELGIDPSPELARLHEQLLAQDPALDLTTEAVAEQIPKEPAREAVAEAAVERPAEERKVVTVLFADITASTELALSLDPEDLLGVLRPFFEAMADEVHRFGGVVEKYIGDAVVAVFGVPAAHDDDPIRGLRVALAMQRRLSELNRERFADTGLELSMTIGVNSGEVVAVREPRPGEGIVTGEAVNVAARLQLQAGPGSIVVGQRTYQTAREAFDFSPLGEVVVKGVARPLPAWEVLRDRREPGERAPGHAPLVGRRSELELLRLLFSRSVAEGRPNLAIIVGPAGVGKSRLSREFTGSIAGEDLPVGVVSGRCLPYGDGLTYWPLAEILKAEAEILDSDPPETILEKASDQLERRFPGERAGTSRILLSSIGVAVRPDPLAGADPHVARDLIARAWRAYFESMAAEHPILVLIDDLHWADEGLLDLLEGLPLRMVGRITVLCLTRPELFDRRPGWGGGIPNVHSVFLSPLTEEESGLLLRYLLEDESIPQGLDRIVELAEGNPFYLEELVTMLVDDGSLVRRKEGWSLDRPLPASLPDTVQTAIGSRIDILPPGEKLAIQDAAIVGRTFWQGALEQLGTPDAVSAIEALVRKGLIREVPSSAMAGDRELSFTHGLIQEVAYSTILKARRTEAHARAGAWIEGVTRGRAEEFAEILAHHFERAGDAERTLRYATLAGHRKRRLFLAREAIVWYDRALAAADRLPSETTSSLVAEATLSRGQARELVAEFTEAQADYERTVDAARTAGEGRREAEALAALARIHRAQDRYEEGGPILDEALTRAQAVGAKDLVIQTLYTAGTIAYGRAEWKETLAFHRQALSLAEAEGDLEGEAFARHGLAETYFFTGPFEEGLATSLRSSDLFRSLGNEHMLYHNEFIVGHLQWVLGRYGDAERTYEEGIAGTRRIGDRWNEGISLTGLANLRLSQGRAQEALDHIMEADAALEGVESPRMKLGVMSFGSLAALPELHAFGRLETAIVDARAFSDKVGSAWMRPRVLTLEGWMDLRAGNDEEARARFEEARAMCGPALWECLWCHRLELLAWEDARSPVGAEAVGQGLRDLARSESPVFLAWGEYGSALAAALRKEWTEAADGAEDALSRAEEIGDRLIAWRSSAVLARTLSELGESEVAERHRTRAREIVEGMARGLRDPAIRDSFLGRWDVTELSALSS